MTGLASSATFEIDDFAFFMTKADDRQPVQKKLVEGKLTQFTDALSKTETVQKLVDLYAKKGLSVTGPAVNPGLFRNDSKNFWVTIGPKERRERCHLTVRILEEGIRLDAFAPHKAFTRRMAEKIHAEPDRFVESLSGIPGSEQFLLRLREAYYFDPDSPYKGQRIQSYMDYLEFHPTFLKVENVRDLVSRPIQDRLGRKDLRPEIFLTRDFRLSEVVGESKIVEIVAAAAAKMIPYLKFALELPE